MENEVKPLFKYIGGKRWLKNNLEVHFKNVLSRKNFTTYVEPFVGGMGAFLSLYELLESSGIKKVVLNDINSHIINFYRIINEEGDFKSSDLIDKMVLFETEFMSLIPHGTHKLHKLKEKHQIKLNLKDANWLFLQKRTRFNELLKREEQTKEEKVEMAALLLFLQAHCFNGIYRENSKGEYNTPFNWAVKEKTRNQLEKDIASVKEVFDKFDLVLTNKSALELEYDENTLYYLDPPYLNDEEDNENKYNKDHFDKKCQLELIELIKGKNFIYSNHNSDLIREAFQLHNIEYLYEIVKRKNIVSASVESRNEDKEEILISLNQ